LLALNSKCLVELRMAHEAGKFDQGGGQSSGHGLLCEVSLSLARLIVGLLSVRKVLCDDFS